jgi:hypothetical protein
MGKGLYMPKKNLYPCERCVYKVIVKASGYPDADAEVKIPVLNVNYSLHVTYPYGYDQNNAPISLFELTFKDVPLDKNYYELALYYKDGSKSFFYLNLPEIKSDDIVMRDEGDMDYNPHAILLADKLFNGTDVVVKFKALDFSIGTFGNPPVLINNYYVVLRSISESYYKYKKYLLRHNYNQNNSGSLDDPLHLLFSGEPSNMYTNINGGYGIFVGYSGIMKQVKLN